MKDFRKLAVWQKAHSLVLAIYRATSSLRRHEHYSLTNQIHRAGVSVPSNIAEGSGHQSDPQLARYLELAAASASEVQYQPILARNLGYLAENTFEDLADKVVEVKRMLSGLMTTLRVGH